MGEVDACVGVLDSDGERNDSKRDYEFIGVENEDEPRRKKQANEANNHAVEAIIDVKEAVFHANEAITEVKGTDNYATEAIMEVKEAVFHANEAITEVKETDNHATEAIMEVKEAVFDANEAITEVKETDNYASEVSMDVEEVNNHAKEGLVEVKEAIFHGDAAIIEVKEVNDHASEAIMEVKEAVFHAKEAIIEVKESNTHASEAVMEVEEAYNHAKEATVEVKEALFYGNEAIIEVKNEAFIEVKETYNHVSEAILEVKEANDYAKEVIMEVKEEQANEAITVVKEASNEDISSEVSNPNDTCSLQTITSTQKPEPVSNKLAVSDEESLSEEELCKSDKTTKVSMTSFVREIPEHISSCGIRKITFKFSKSREDYENENKSLVPAVRSVGDEAFDSSRYVAIVKKEENSSYRDRVEESYSYSYQRYKKTNKSKKIFGESHLMNVKKLLSSGVLEGARVKYITTAKWELPGIIRDWGYTCSCSSCNYSRILSAYEFEAHAGVTTKHPNNHIFLENGRPIYSVIQELKSSPLNMVDEVIRKAAGSAVNEEIFLAWRERIKRKTALVNAENYAERRWMTEIKQPFTHSHSLSSYKKQSIYSNRRRDNELHRVLFMPGGLPDGAELAYYAKGHKVLYGYKQGIGIVCSCCDTEVSPSQFEAHAGWSARRQPYRNIYTSSGLTLHDIALSLARGQKLATGSSDDMCAACGDGGDLVICDGCPRSFHAVCLNLDCSPNGEWYCPFCRDIVGLGHKTVGQPSIMGKPIAIRMTRVVKAPEIVAGGCVVCRASDFSAEKFDDRTVMLCDQCEREYHVGCLRDQGLADLKELPKDKWFCCDECTKINVRLQNIVLVGAEAIPTMPLNFINMKHLRKGFGEIAVSDVQWQILSGKSRVAEHLPILSRAAAIFRECFDPIVATSGRDLIPVMVYGRNISGQEFGGMYCVVLIVKSIVVSAGLLRILGRDAAELPLVATSRDHQGRGYFQALFSCIEGLLHSLNVENVVLPAAEEALSIWTNKLGFRKMSNERFMKYTRELQLTSFKGTSMLEKPVRQQTADK